MTTQREIPANYDPQEAMREGLEAMLADARIRKAAPALLAALKALKRLHDDGAIWMGESNTIEEEALVGDAWEQARAAIEAAEGGTG